MIYDNVLDAVGNTPLIRLNKMTGPEDAEILVKFEAVNIGGSVKTRTAKNMIEAAEEKGLGLCYLGTTAYNAGEIIKILSLPRLVVPIITITLGYPEEPLPAQSERLPLAAILHEESYHDYTPESIDRFYKEKEELEVNKEFVRINHKETLAQVFTDLRYPKANNEHFSEVLLQVLKEQGFLKDE